MSYRYDINELPDGNYEMLSHYSDRYDNPVATGYYSDRTGILTYCDSDCGQDEYVGLECLEDARELFCQLLDCQIQEDVAYISHNI